MSQVGPAPMRANHLRRAIGRWSLTALMVNTMIGASAFGVPSLLAAHLGKLSPQAYFAAAVGVGTIAACLAEVSSSFEQPEALISMPEPLSGALRVSKWAGSRGFRGSRLPLL
jgi:amino acid transporter